MTSWPALLTLEAMISLIHAQAWTGWCLVHQGSRRGKQGRHEMTFDLGFLQAGLLLSWSGQSRADIRDLWPTTQDCGSVAPYTEPPASGKLGRPGEQQVIAKGHLPPFHTSGSPEILSLRQNKYSKGQIDFGVRDRCLQPSVSSLLPYLPQE